MAPALIRWWLVGWLMGSMTAAGAGEVLFLGSDTAALATRDEWSWQPSESRSALRSITTLSGDTLQGFRAVIPGGTATMANESPALAEHCQDEHADVIVAYGWDAAQAAVRECARPLLVVAAPRQQMTPLLVRPPPKGIAAIYLEAEPALNLPLVRALLPNARTVGVLVPTPSADWLPALRQAARRGHLELIEIAVTTDLDAVRTLRGHLTVLDAVLLPPDPTVINEWSLKPLLLMTLRQGVPTLGGLTARYVQAGVLAAVVADEDRLLEQMRPLISALRDGHPPAPTYPEAVRVVVNPTVAQTLGVPAEAVERARALLPRF